MTKLSPAQRRVLEAMRDGAVLHKDHSITGRAWLSWRTPYRTETVRVATWFKLYKLKLIEGERTWPATTYELTQAGRAALQQSGVGEGIRHE